MNEEKNISESENRVIPELPIDDADQKDIVKVLPRAIITALTSYENFLKAGFQAEEKPPATVPESKSYQEHQSACKAAVAHIELLVKLTERIKISSSDDQKDHMDRLESFVTDALMEIEKREQGRKT